MSSAQIYDMLQRQVKAEGDGGALRGGRIGGRQSYSAEGGLFSAQSRTALANYALFRAAHKGIGREELKALWAAHKRNSAEVSPTVNDAPEGSALGGRRRLMLGAPSGGLMGGFAGQREVFARIRAANPSATRKELAMKYAMARAEATATPATSKAPRPAPVKAEWNKEVIKRAIESSTELAAILNGVDPYTHMKKAAIAAASRAVIMSPVAESHPEIAQQVISDLAKQELINQAMEELGLDMPKKRAVRRSAASKKNKAIVEEEKQPRAPREVVRERTPEELLAAEEEYDNFITDLFGSEEDRRSILRQSLLAEGIPVGDVNKIMTEDSRKSKAMIEEAAREKKKRQGLPYSPLFRTL